MPQTAILLIDCPDRKGLVAAVANFLLQEYDANVLNADQHQDVERGLFFMRVEFTTEKAGCDAAQFHRAFSPIAEQLRLHWQLHFADAPEKVAIFASQYLHCLADLLYRHQNGEFRSHLSMIVSNHENAQALAEFYQVPFHYLPTHAGIRAQVEEQQLKLLANHNVDLVVLARYMQVLSPKFVAALSAEDHQCAMASYASHSLLREQDSDLRVNCGGDCCATAAKDHRVLRLQHE